MEKIEINLNLRVSLGDRTLQFFRDIFNLKETEKGIADATSNLIKSSTTLKKAVDRNK